MQDITTRNKQTKVKVETVRYMVAQFHVINCIRTRLLTIQDMRTLNKQTNKQTNKQRSGLRLYDTSWHNYLVHKLYSPKTIDHARHNNTEQTNKGQG